jgi:hypothetical protein
LAAAASAMEVRRRAEELKVRAQLESAPAEHIERLRAAEAALADPLIRLQHELLWFYLSPDPVPPDIDLAGDVDAMVEELRQRSKQSDLALHDLAVLEHASALEGSPKHLESALRDWVAVWKTDEFWVRLEMRAKDLADPRITPETIDEFRTLLPGQVLSMTASHGRQAIKDGLTDVARRDLEVMLAAGFPHGPTQVSRDTITVDLRAEVRSASHELVQAYTRWTEKDPDVAGSFQQVEHRVASIGRSLAVLVEVDNTAPVTQVVVDEVAEGLRGLSIAAWNSYQEDQVALRALEAGSYIAASAIVRGRINQDIATVSKLAADVERAAAAARPRPPVSNIASRPTAKRTGGGTRLSLGGVAAFVIFLVLRSLLSSSNTSVNQTSSQANSRPSAAATTAARPGSTPGALPKPSAGSPSFSPGTSTANSPVSSPVGTRAQIESLGASIDAERPQLDTEATRLSNVRTQLDAMDSQLTAIENQYPNGAPSYVVAQYNDLRSRYNALLAQYQSDAGALRSRNAAFNAKVAQYNGLIGKP